MATAAAAALTLSSCLVLPFMSADPSSTGPGGSGGAGGAGSAAAVATPPPDHPELADYYSQTLQWRPCSGGECATLKVPVDYAKAGGDRIELKLLRVLAKTPSARIGSLVVNPGGPGGSGVDYARYADQIVGAEVRKRFDVVGFDPRGVGLSAPLDCISDAELDTFLGMDPTPDDKAEQEAFVAGSRKLAAGCAANGGALLGHLSTVEAARDMDILRAALREPKLHYLGKSYGTFLGATYADLFPLNVGRFVLDGVVPPDLTSAEVSEGQARGFEMATKAYLQSCISKGNCPAGDSVEEGMQWIKDFLLKLDANPLPVSGDARITELTEAWGSIGLAYAMYSKSSWVSLTAALRSAQQGDGTDLMDLADQYADRTTSGSYTGNIMEVIYAVNCLDRPDTADLAVVEANAEKFSASAPLWGRMLAWGSVPCGVWPVKATGAPKKVTAAGSGPIVVVGTTRDPATIYEWSVRLRQELANAVLISFDGDGHTAYTRSNSCVDRPIDAYYVNGTVPQDGLSC